MQALVDLVSTYVPGFAGTVVPAEERRIQSLQRLAGPLPGALLRFLRTMGGSPPRFLVESLSLGVDPMRRALISAEWLKDERYLFLSHDDENDADLWIDRATPTPPDDAVVAISAPMETPAALPRTPYAVGLEDFLYVEAFRTRRLPLFDHQASLATAEHPPSAAAVQGALALPPALGFSRLAPQLTSALFERGDAAIVVRRAPADASVNVWIAAEQPKALAALVDAYLADPIWKRP